MSFLNDEFWDNEWQLKIDRCADGRKNYDLAKAYLERNTSKEQIQGILYGIDFSKPVEIVRLQQGEVLQRYESQENRHSLYPDGRYFSEPGTPEAKLGLKDISTDTESIKHRDFFIVTKDIEVLRSTSSDHCKSSGSFNPSGLIYEGGGLQYFVSKPQLHSLERLVHTSHKQTSTTIPETVKTQKDKISHKAELAKSLRPQLRADSKRIGPKKSK